METMVVENSEVEISEEESVKEISGNSLSLCLNDNQYSVFRMQFD